MTQVMATNALNQYTVDYANDNATVYNQWKVVYESLKNVNAAIGRAGAVVTKIRIYLMALIRGYWLSGLRGSQVFACALYL